ncbi:MAG: lipopolysaccharide heptosyltransferase I [Gammaproteobacteria bacterium]|nr:lipopolysaccharide heptosyltransferase I [Gammaproteobacteria bacterium]
MRILIIKTSSMGDIIHTLPALTDAVNAIPDITFDWVVEEKFAEIPSWHDAVEHVIPVAWRRWRRKLWSPETLKQWQTFRKNLDINEYDKIIDAQGLIKSAIFTWLANGPGSGFDWRSARESAASLVYQHVYPVPKDLHAVTRVRTLFSLALGYDLPNSVPEYGIDKTRFLSAYEEKQDYIVFLHGTTWPTKHWPEEYWIGLAKLANAAGLLVKLPWGSQAEHERARRIASCVHAELLPQLDLMELAEVLAGAKAVVAVDTGLGHLAAALDVPSVSLYGPTNPGLTGALGKSQVHLTATFPCSPCLSKKCTFAADPQHPPFSVFPPCFSTLNPSIVWDALMGLLN